MKTQNSPGYASDDYTVIPLKQFPYFTLESAAARLKVRKQRLSRLLRILRVPIYKVGTLVLMDQSAVDRIEEAVKNNEVKRGRKPNAA